MDGWFPAALAALIGALGGGLLAPWISSAIAHRVKRRQAFDSAIAAVQGVIYAYTAPSFVDPSEIGGGVLAEEFNERLPVARMERFFDATYEMRRAIAELEPYYTLEWTPGQFQPTQEVLRGIVNQLRRAR